MYLCIFLGQKLYKPTVDKTGVKKSNIRSQIFRNQALAKLIFNNPMRKNQQMHYCPGKVIYTKYYNIKK